MTSEIEPTTIALGLHGQTAWNAEGKFQGSSDIELNQRGREQAHEAADWLLANYADLGWDAVRYSPLRRAAETGRIIAERLSIETTMALPALVERDWGVGEGLNTQEIFERWPEVETPENIHLGRNLIPGVEPFDLMVARGRYALETMTIQYPGGKVIATAHGTIIRFTLRAVLEEQLGYVPNVGVVVLRCWPDAAGLRVELADTSFDRALPEPFGYGARPN